MPLPLLAVAVLGVLAAGYLLYGRFVARQYALDDARATPATLRADGADFVPTGRFYLLGQHFSAIAAAGPIVGPILACQTWGWLPCVLWIGLGVVFVGAVHDLTALVASVRHNNEVVFFEDVFLDQIFDAVVAADLLVGYETEAYLILRRDAEFFERQDSAERGNQLLAVVVDAAAVDAAVPDHGLERISVPEREISGRHHIHVRNDHEALFREAGDRYEQVRSDAAFCLRIRAVDDLRLAEAQLFYFLRKVLSFSVFAFAARQRADGRNGAEIREYVRYFWHERFYSFKEFFFHCDYLRILFYGLPREFPCMSGFALPILSSAAAARTDEFAIQLYCFD